MKTFSINSPTYGQFNVLVDDEDFERVIEHTWSVQRDRKSDRFYISTNIKIEGKYKTILLHRLVRPQYKKVDHINLNPLDNQKENLREGTEFNNQNRGKSITNTSGFKGVTWNKKRRGWQAQITSKREYKQLGIFSCKEAAARAYNTASMELHGSYGRLNIVEGLCADKCCCK